MADLQSTGEVLELCPVCRIKVYELENERFGCEKCKRIWYWDFLEGMWISEARLVRLTKQPEAGDSPDDFLEPIK